MNKTNPQQQKQSKDNNIKKITKTNNNTLLPEVNEGNTNNTPNINNEEKDLNTRKLYKKTSIKNSTYVRPPITYTDRLTKEQIETLLIDFEEIKNIADIPIGTFIRYFEDKDGELKFRVGGILTVKRPEEGYIYLKNNQINWPVQLPKCLLFRKITTKEIKDEYELKLFEKTKENNELISYIKKLEKDILSLKKKLINK